jgi:hypothetical protein
MKRGWFHINSSNGTQEPLAPKTTADMVYVDSTQHKTVQEALAEGTVAVFEHTLNVTGSVRAHAEKLDAEGLFNNDIFLTRFDERMLEKATLVFKEDHPIIGT